jgi:hypothetical protein
LHAPPAQLCGEHSSVPLSEQWPAPSQVSAFVRTVPLQDAAAQTAPTGYSLQLLVPLQFPLVPHDAAPWSPHSLYGSVSAGIAEQAPDWPTRLQCSQTPSHAPLQHTVSAQKPVAQSEPTEQGSPLFFLQTPDTHE